MALQSYGGSGVVASVIPDTCLIHAYAEFLLQARSKLGLPSLPGGAPQKAHQSSSHELNVGAQRWAKCK